MRDLPGGYEAEISLDLIDVTERLRELDEGAAQQLALAIGKNGLINAITLRPSDHGRYELVAGRHRLRAHEILDRETIRSFVRELTDDEAEILEIEENVFRTDLSAIERIKSVGLWVQSFRTAHPELKHGGDRGNQHTGGKLQTLQLARPDEILAQKTGRSQRSIYDDVAIFDALGEEALTMLASSQIADNASQLKALCKLEPDHREACAEALAGEAFKSVSEWRAAVGDQRPKDELSPKEKWLQQMGKLWGEGKKGWRDEFLREIGEQA
ncbi:ParB-like nuclease domain-containing protein [Aliiroseovarius crassostreae]|uniref:ParB-like N-terminal domain-containing protein n=1 Tax=Aliiroseovarius crassostreae TaxID=154981 RepID=A0A0P7IJX3_9RHOB|nr:ParB N-terminal domain-containing protein [Aliiroseovarius crassostreae]KPN64284.1 hypothetical protein AKJ29_16760 [Aliiroseovarius crassostreae]SFU31644.1 ParB-like nuclease domain-containing protein [Aliiroseovarius crassostreae]